MRSPAVAGRFYPFDETELDKEVEKSFFSDRGPGSLHVEETPPVKGGVAPHAGYVYSAPVAAKTISRMAQPLREAGSVVIIGPNHTGYGGHADVSLRDFSSPGGVVENDKEFSQLLVDNGLSNEEMSHSREHSLEVQLPLLRKAVKGVKISPIVMGDQSFVNSKRVAEAIIKADKQSGRKSVVLASSDFSHVGDAYGHPVPKGKTPGDYAKERDSTTFDLVEKLDAKGFLKQVRRESLSICGAGPIAVAMMVSKETGGSAGKVIQYTTSFDISPGDMAVGYASIIFQ